MEILKTDRLSLRTWTMDDLHDGFAIWGDAEVMKYIDSGAPEALEQVKISLQAGIDHQQKHGYQHWAVAENTSQKIIGACGFNRGEIEGELELVFHFSKSSWGKGYATEAAQACITYAVQNLKPAKIIAGFHPENHASKRVLQKAGLIFVGNRWFEDTQQEEPCFELSVGL